MKHRIILHTRLLSTIRTQTCTTTAPWRGSYWARTMSSLQPQFADGSDAQALSTALAPLLSSSPGGSGRWSLSATGEGLERSFKFKTFAKTWDFMTAVSLQCKIKKHHPEWSNVFNNVFVRWTTHQPQGLSAKDVEMARYCDEVAQDLGEEAETASADTVCEMKSMTDQLKTKSADCCVPKRS